MNDISVEIRTNPIMCSLPDMLLSIPHIHKELELIFVETGKVHAFSDKKSYELNSGDIFLTFPNQVHYYENSVKGKYHLIIFSADILFGIKNITFDNILNSSLINTPNKETLARLIKKLSINTSELFYQTLCAGILNQIMALILKNCELIPRIKSNNTTIQNILSFCEHNYQNDLSLENIAKILHLNKNHISHIFNEKLGVNFNTYINALRISKACDLLQTTNKKAADISEEVGFGSIRSFNRAFIDIMNITPIKYRNQMKAKKQLI